MAGPPRTKEEGGVGCAVGDYDNDGHLDIFVPNYGHNLLYRNNGNGTFTDVARTVGVASRTTPSAPTGATTTTTATSICR